MRMWGGVRGRERGDSSVNVRYMLLKDGSTLMLMLRFWLCVILACIHRGAV